MFAEDDSEGGEEGEGGEDKDAGVEPEDADFQAEVFFGGAEEDIQVAVFAVVALFHFGFGDEVGDFLVHIDLLGGEAGAEFGEAGGFEGGAGDDVVDAAERGAKLAGSGCFEAGKEGEGVFEILEAFFLLRRGVSLTGELVDHRLDFFLSAGERVELGLREDKGFVGPAGRHDFANERDL